MSSIHYDFNEQCITIRLRTSYYALRILPDGSVIHVGSGSLPTDVAEETAGLLTGLNGYSEQNFAFEQQSRMWEVPAFGDVTFHDVAIKLAFVRAAGHDDGNESANLPVRDLRLRYSSHDVTTESPGLSQPRGPLRETLCVRLRDTAYDFGVTIFYRVTPQYDIIERWLELQNDTNDDVTVESLAFGTVHMPNGRYEVTHAAGSFTREFVPVRHEIAQGRTVIESLSINTGNMSNPTYLLNEIGAASEDSGRVFFGALAYSGNWRLSFESFASSALRVTGGYHPVDFSLTLPPGGSHRTPAFIYGWSAEGWGGASRRLHGFAADFVLPVDRHGRDRPVLYNSWEAVYFAMSSENQMALARKAAEIGVELFCVDDGWFGGRRDDKTGLGDWFVSPEVFPDGLGPLIEEVKRLGMRFGLWVEPEMINVNSDLYRAHPDWILHYPGRPRTEMRNQLILDFGRPEVVDYIYDCLDKLLKNHDISFFKWDMNRYATEPGSVVGKEIWLRHVTCLYDVMDRLRAAHPRLEIQSCSGGGSRIDYGVLQRAEQVWVSDNTDAYDRTLIQDGFSLFYPPRTMEAWVTHQENHQTGRSASLDLRFDVAMRGVLGIGSSLNELSPDEICAYRRKIAFYKQIRPIVQGGELHRLATEDGVSTWFTITPDRNQAVYSAVVTRQLQGVFHAPARLPGLRPKSMYVATDECGRTVGKWSGFQLAALGIPGDLSNGGAHSAARSRTLLLSSIGKSE